MHASEMFKVAADAQAYREKRAMGIVLDNMPKVIKTLHKFALDGQTSCQLSKLKFIIETETAQRAQNAVWKALEKHLATLGYTFRSAPISGSIIMWGG